MRVRLDSRVPREPPRYRAPQLAARRYSENVLGGRETGGEVTSGHPASLPPGLTLTRPERCLGHPFISTNYPCEIESVALVLTWKQQRRGREALA